jgi:hypothetical protein
MALPASASWLQPILLVDQSQEQIFLIAYCMARAYFLGFVFFLNQIVFFYLALTLNTRTHTHTHTHTHTGTNTLWAGVPKTWKYSSPCVYYPSYFSPLRTELYKCLAFVSESKSIPWEPQRRKTFPTQLGASIFCVPPLFLPSCKQAISQQPFLSFLLFTYHILIDLGKIRVNFISTMGFTFLPRAVFLKYLNS